VAAITATLARYPEDVIRAVTHPASGLPIQKDFLPTVAEVYRACEAEMQPRREAAARDTRRKKQIAEGREWDRQRAENSKARDDAARAKLPPASEGEERVA
jgi:hypothetical protein